MRKRCNVTLLAGVVLVTLTTGCKKRVAVAPPAPTPVQEVKAPTPKSPFASITAEPSKVEPGQAVTLKWIATDATEVAISELGLVAVEGKQDVRPVKSTTYELVAKGPGGAVMAYATVEVVAAPPLIMIEPPPLDTRSLQQRLEAEVADLYFDYDKSDIREDARAVLAKDAEALRSILADLPNAVVILEGHCDERGSAEYNIALGDRRAASVAEYFEQLGLPHNFKSFSYGKERPQCTDSTEACRQLNRRVHFAAGGPATGSN